MTGIVFETKSRLKEKGIEFNRLHNNSRVTKANDSIIHELKE